MVCEGERDLFKAHQYCKALTRFVLTGEYEHPVSDRSSFEKGGQSLCMQGRSRQAMTTHDGPNRNSATGT